SLGKDEEGNALKVVDRDATAGVGLSQFVPGQPGHEYVFSAETKGGPVYLYLRFHNAQRRVIEPEHRVPALRGETWRRRAIREIAPPATAWVEAWAYSASDMITETLIRRPELHDEGVGQEKKGPLTSDKELFAALDLDFPGLEATRAAVARGDLDAAKAAWFDSRRTRSQPRWSLEYRPDRPADPTVYPTPRPSAPAAASDPAGDRILQHLFAMPWGSDRHAYPVGAKIDWASNPRKRSDPAHSQEWTYIALHRFYFWIHLADAYWETLDEKYAREWAAELESWVEENPVPLDAAPGDTVAWRTIEAAIRMNEPWPYAYYRQIELTLSYHQVARESFAGIAKLAILNSVPFPARYLDKLKAMYEWNLRLMDQRGEIPTVNDGDPFNRVTRSLEEAYGLWGGDEFLFGATLGKQGKAPPLSSFLPYSGYYALRSGWGPDDLYLFFDAGPVGTAHWHEDMLNLLLGAFGRTLLTEAGGYPYDKSEWRRYSISTQGHNTVTVDGKEQRRGVDGAKAVMEPVKSLWCTTPLFDQAAGTYDAGYQATRHADREYFPVAYVGERDRSIAHTRHVIFLKPYYVLAVDFLTGRGEHRYDAHFHLDAPDATLDEGTKAAHTTRPDGAQLGLLPLDTDGLQARIVKGQQEPVLGWALSLSGKRPIPTVVYTKQAPAPTTFATLLYPYQGVRPQVVSKELSLGHELAWSRQLTTPHETAIVIVRRGREPAVVEVPPGLVPGFSTDARLVVIRKPVNSATAWIGLEGATTFAAADLSFTAAAPAALVLAREGGGGRLLAFNAGAQEARLAVTKPFARTAILAPGAWTHLAAEQDTVVPQPPERFP
ncbi:MAG: alginate lyase family protein, partial [Planctomycetota bacterium]|nr:alginate lyase family protein [Planctomycetota bacterium]